MILPQLTIPATPQALTTRDFLVSSATATDSNPCVSGITPLSPDCIPKIKNFVTGLDQTPKTGEKPSLGSITKSQSKNKPNLANAQNNRRSAYALKNTSARLLPSERVNYCLNHRVTDERGIDVKLNQDTGRASYGNLIRCDSVWLCPCCSSRILAERGKEVEKAVDAWTEQGGSVFMLTLTHSHSRDDNLALKMKLLQKALSRFFGDRAMKAIFQQFGKIGQITALEVTQSNANGWHPHHHILMFSELSPDEFLNDVVSVTYDKDGFVQYVDNEREKRLIKKGRIDDIRLITFEQFIKNYWVKICKAVGLGLPTIKHGATVQNAGAVKSYLTKYKTAQELVNAQSKKGKNGSRNQWEILADAHAGDAHSGRLWQIYADAFKGKRQLFWSRGLKAMFGIDDVADAQIEDMNETEGTVLTIADISIENWRYIRRKNWQPQILEIVENDFKNGTDNFEIFILSVAYLIQKERAEYQQKERERIRQLVPPEWFKDLHSFDGEVA